MRRDLGEVLAGQLEEIGAARGVWPDDLRALAHELRPPVAEDDPTVQEPFGAMTGEFETIFGAAGVEVSFDDLGPEADPAALRARLDEAVEKVRAGAAQRRRAAWR